MNREFVEECPRDHLWGRGGQEAGLGRKRNPAGMQAQWKPCLTSVGSWSFRVVLSCDEMVRPLYSHMDQSLDVSCPGKWCHPGPKWAILKETDTWKPSADSTPRSGATCSSLKGDLAHHSVCHTTTRWLQKNSAQGNTCVLWSTSPHLLQNLLLQFS